MQPGDLFDIGGGVRAHPSAVIANDCEIGEGTVIRPFVQILPGAQIGSRCRIGPYSVVSGRARIGDAVTLESRIDVWPEVTIDDDVFIGPSVVFTNDLTPRAYASKHGIYVPTHVCRGASIGANATIVCGIEVGEYSAVGAGSLLRNSVPAFTLWTSKNAMATRAREVCQCNEWGKLIAVSGDTFACELCCSTYRVLDGTVVMLSAA